MLTLAYRLAFLDRVHFRRCQLEAEGNNRKHRMVVLICKVFDEHISQIEVLLRASGLGSGLFVCIRGLCCLVPAQARLALMRSRVLRL